MLILCPLLWCHYESYLLKEPLWNVHIYSRALHWKRERFAVITENMRSIFLSMIFVRLQRSRKIQRLARLTKLHCCLRLIAREKDIDEVFPIIESILTILLIYFDASIVLLYWLKKINPTINFHCHDKSFILLQWTVLNCDLVGLCAHIK